MDRLASRKRRKGENEALDRLQMMLPGLNWSAANNDNAKPKATKDKDKRTRGNNENRDDHGKAPYPAHLTRRDEHIRVPDAERMCKRCSIEMTLKAWLPPEILAKIPAWFFVRRILRERLECPCCRAESVVAEPVDTVKDGGSLDLDLVVDATVDHFQDATPYERMARNAKAMGVPLAANTLASNVGALIDLCDPIVEHVFHRCVTSDVVGADGTSMPVLDPKHPRGIYRATLWNLLGDGRFSYFGYAPTGEANHLAKLLAGCTLDVLQCDGASTLNEIERVSKKRAGCHSHGRSYLVIALKHGDARAITPLLIYAQLFAIEAESKARRESHADRLVRRVVKSQPLLLKLWAWVDEMRPQVEPKTPLGQALTYLSNLRKRLELFLSDGRVAMTNNAVERELRTYMLDRKTWLFNGNEKNAKRTAAALTIIRTCKLLGTDPRAYLRFVVRLILAGEKDASKLWPENFAAQQAQASRQNAA
jgi:transposase